MLYKNIYLFKNINVKYYLLLELKINNIFMYLYIYI